MSSTSSSLKRKADKALGGAAADLAAATTALSPFSALPTELVHRILELGGSNWAWRRVCRAWRAFVMQQLAAGKAGSCAMVIPAHGDGWTQPPQWVLDARKVAPRVVIVGTGFESGSPCPALLGRRLELVETRTGHPIQRRLPFAYLALGGICADRIIVNEPSCLRTWHIRPTMVKAGKVVVRSNMDSYQALSWIFGEWTDNLDLSGCKASSDFMITFVPKRATPFSSLALCLKYGACLQVLEDLATSVRVHVPSGDAVAASSAAAPPNVEVVVGMDAADKPRYW